MDLAFEVAAFGCERVEFALFRGERDFPGMQIGAENGEFGFEDGFVALQFGPGHFLTRDLRGQFCDFLRERADFADVTLGDGAENAVFVDEFSLDRRHGEMWMVLTQRKGGVQITDNDTHSSMERISGSNRASRTRVIALAHAMAPRGSSLFGSSPLAGVTRARRRRILQAAGEQLAGGAEVVGENRVDRVIQGRFDGGAVLRFDFENLTERRAAIGSGKELLQHFQARAFAGHVGCGDVMLVVWP